MNGERAFGRHLGTLKQLFGTKFAGPTKDDDEKRNHEETMAEKRKLFGAIGSKLNSMSSNVQEQKENNDSDLYSSTLYCLTMLDKFLVDGAILIFDEFYSSSHEFQAFIDYTRAYQKQYKVLASVGKDPYIQVVIMMQ